jgi:hypothetical protein
MLLLLLLYVLLCKLLVLFCTFPLLLRICTVLCFAFLCCLCSWHLWCYSSRMSIKLYWNNWIFLLFHFVIIIIINTTTTIICNNSSCFSLRSNQILFSSVCTVQLFCLYCVLVEFLCNALGNE